VRSASSAGLVCSISATLFCWAAVVRCGMTSIFAIANRSTGRSSVIWAAKYCCVRSSLSPAKIAQ
jgi:hypothetical protein